jgi:large subunit ribosomal protein L7A
MLNELLEGQKLVGIKQSTKAVLDGIVIRAYISKGIDPRIKEPFVALCNKNNIPITIVSSKKELGIACKIDVPASVAVLIKEPNLD